jgi:alcohol dehydrogenase
MIVLRTPPVIRVGEGALSHVGADVRSLGAETAFVVTTPGMRARDALLLVEASLREARVAATVWARAPAEPGFADLDAALHAAEGVDPDVVVGLGGGSAMDLAKLVALLLAHPGPVDRYLGTGLVPGPCRPTVLVPTTAGSGSEVSPDAVLTDRAAGTKVAVEDAALVSSVACVDPVASSTCPAALTATCGLDALTQAVEAFTGLRANAVTDLYALEAIRLIRTWLPVAVDDGANLEARLHMALGSLLAGLAFGTTGTAGVHACGYPVSGLFGVPHGAANAILLPAVCSFNAETCSKYERIEEAFETHDLPAALEELVRRVGLPTRLHQAGVPREELPRLAAIAAADERHLSVNPRRLAEDDLERLFEEVW